MATSIIIFLLLGILAMAKRRYENKSKIRRQEQYARERAEFYRRERAKVINHFLWRCQNESVPVDVLLGELRFCLEINDGQTGEWYRDYCEAAREICRQEAAKQEKRQEQAREAQQREERRRRDEAFRSAFSAGWGAEANDGAHAWGKSGKVEFNGVWVNPMQALFLRYSPAVDMRGDELLDFLSFLGEHIQMFAEFYDTNRSQRCHWQQEKTQNRTASAANAGINVAAYYRIFGLTPETLTAQSLKAAYRRLSLKYHPDENHAPDAKEKFQKVQKVYEFLKGELRRKGG